MKKKTTSFEVRKVYCNHCEKDLSTPEDRSGDDVCVVCDRAFYGCQDIVCVETPDGNEHYHWTCYNEKALRGEKT